MTTNDSAIALRGAALARPRRVFLYREKSDHTGELIKALAAAQGEFAPVVKDARAQYGSFASLTSMRRATTPALAAHGLAVTFEYADIEDVPFLVCVLSHETDQFLSSVIRLERIADPQKRSAYMTYMKRAAYSAILCLAAEDDDDGDTAAAAVAEAAAGAWKEQWRLAQDAIKSASTIARVDQILAKGLGKIDQGEMDPGIKSQLETLARARRDALAQARQESRPVPQEAGK